MGNPRDAWRTLKATPVVTAVAVFSLALGIGANTAIFSIVNSLLIRTLPVSEPERLVQVLNSSTPQRGSSWSNPLWEALRGHTELFDSAFAWSSTSFNLAERGETQIVAGIWASGDFFKVLGVQPILGRTFTAADDARGGGPRGRSPSSAISFWQRRFGGAADVVGTRADASTGGRSRSSASRRPVLRPRRRPRVRRRRSDRRRAADPARARARSIAASWWWLNVMARLEARAERRAGDRAPARRPAADSRGDAADHWISGRRPRRAT